MILGYTKEKKNSKVDGQVNINGRCDKVSTISNISSLLSDKSGFGSQLQCHNEDEDKKKKKKKSRRSSIVDDSLMSDILDNMYKMRLCDEDDSTLVADRGFNGYGCGLPMKYSHDYNNDGDGMSIISGASETSVAVTEDEKNDIGILTSLLNPVMSDDGKSISRISDPFSLDAISSDAQPSVVDCNNNNYTETPSLHHFETDSCVSLRSFKSDGCDFQNHGDHYSSAPPTPMSYSIDDVVSVRSCSTRTESSHYSSILSFDGYNILDMKSEECGAGGWECFRVPNRDAAAVVITTVLKRYYDMKVGTMKCRHHESISMISDVVRKKKERSLIYRNKKRQLNSRITPEEEEEERYSNHALINAMKLAARLKHNAMNGTSDKDDHTMLDDSNNVSV